MIFVQFCKLVFDSFDLLSVHTLISTRPSFISRIHNYCNLISVEQLKSGANCLTPDGDTFQFYTSHQMTPLVLNSYLIVTV